MPLKEGSNAPVTKLPLGLSVTRHTCTWNCPVTLFLFSVCDFPDLGGDSEESKGGLSNGG